MLVVHGLVVESVRRSIDRRQPSEGRSQHPTNQPQTDRHHKNPSACLELGAVPDGHHVPDEVVGHVEGREIREVLQPLVFKKGVVGCVFIYFDITCGGLVLLGVCLYIICGGLGVAGGVFIYNMWRVRVCVVRRAPLSYPILYIM